jgi:hypothetical protein
MAVNFVCTLLASCNCKVRGIQVRTLLQYLTFFVLKMVSKCNRPINVYVFVVNLQVTNYTRQFRRIRDHVAWNCCKFSKNVVSRCMCRLYVSSNAEKLQNNKRDYVDYGHDVDQLLTVPSVAMKMECGRICWCGCIVSVNCDEWIH